MMGTTDRRSSTPRLNYTGYLFEIDVYRKCPLSRLHGVNKAFHLFTLAVALIERIDLSKITSKIPHPSLN
ncbi:MAG TPA: hypothetical protein VGY98_11710 [Verrucomicrobiae bacterium]|nr:hypothetical protein [Verrucomicrobiae bacterium]